MTDQGCIRTETHDHVFKIIIDNPARKNAFSPQMMMQLSDALTELHEIDGHRVGVVCAEGKDFTAGLDMPKFFGPTAERRTPKQGNVDVFGLGKRCKKPIVTAVQGIVFTIGFEPMKSRSVAMHERCFRHCQRYLPTAAHPGAMSLGTGLPTGPKALPPRGFGWKSMA